MSVVKFILDLGPSVMMPIILIILGIIFRQKLSEAIRAGFTVGIGFVGINLVINLLSSNLSPATQAMVKNWGLNLDVMDVGWPVLASISFGTKVVPAVFITCILLNFIMLAMNWTKTMNVDIWNYWHFILAAALAMFVFDNILVGVIVAGLAFIIILKLADWTQPWVEKYFGLPGISTPHCHTVEWAPIAYVLNKVWDKIPGINKININKETIQKRLGIFGEPMFIGIFLGAFIGILAKYDAKGIIQLAVSMGAVMYLLPAMVRILMEGLMPLSDSAREFLNKRFPGKEIYMGLDVAVVVGDPANMAIALLMIPIVLILSTILPGNRILPFVDLADLPFEMIWITAMCRGNVFRGILTGTIVEALALLMATNMAPAITAMGHQVQFAFPAGTSSISALDAGTHLVPFILYKITQLISML